MNPTIDLLRHRWNSDKSARTLAQLAEEYRRIEAYEEAIELLREGLQEHPEYTAAQLLLGRCLKEAGDSGAARQTFEKIRDKDPTHLLANRLLVETLLDLGEPEEAETALGRYRILQPADPSLEGLEARLEEVREAPATTRGSRDLEAPDSDAFVTTESVPDVEPSADQAALPTRSEALAPAPEMDVGGQELGESRPGLGDLFEAGAMVRAPQGLEVLRDRGPRRGRLSSLPFPELRGVGHLAVDGELFAAQDWTHTEAREVSESGPVPSPVAEPELPAFDAPSAREGAVGSEAISFDEQAKGVVAEPGAAEPEAEEVESVAAAEDVAAFEEEPPASAELPTPKVSATLGDLYARQGYADQATEVYREVLRREPDNERAQAGLQRVLDSEASGLVAEPSSEDRLDLEVADVLPALQEADSGTALVGESPSQEPPSEDDEALGASQEARGAAVEVEAPASEATGAELGEPSILESMNAAAVQPEVSPAAAPSKPALDSESSDTDFRLGAAELLADLGEVGLSERKLLLLRRYLKRIQQARVA